MEDNSNIFVEYLDSYEQEYVSYDQDFDYFEDENDFSEEDSFVKPARVHISENKRITMNDVDIDNLSIYELEHLLGLLKDAEQEAEIRLISKRLRRMSKTSRGNKKRLLRRIREADFDDQY